MSNFDEFSDSLNCWQKSTFRRIRAWQLTKASLLQQRLHSQGETGLRTVNIHHKPSFIQSINVII